MRTHVDTATVAAPIDLKADRSRDHSTDAGAETTHFYLTGFKNFSNVAVNPTQLVIDALPIYLAANPLSPSASLRIASVLEVAATTVRSELDKMYNKLAASTPLSHLVQGQQPRQQHRPPQPVFIHLGVHVCTTRFRLEVEAVNEATFSCPDEAGWAPIRAPIDPLNTDISAVARTSLDIPALLSALAHRGFDVEQSSDAGRFVCNWTYYHSLQRAAPAGVQVLFVHVPPAYVIPIERQVRFIAALLDCIAALDTPPPKSTIFSS